jgi:hypothetical protein
MRSWKQYLSEYSDYSNDMFVVKYEELMSEPVATLKKLARYLEISTDDALINEIIVTFFNKELAYKDKTKEMEKIRHFSGSGIVSGEWKKWFNDYMVDAVKKEIGEDLFRFGYENDINWSADIPATESDVLFRKRLDMACSAYAQYDRLTPSKLDTMLESKKAVMYGAGMNTLELIGRFKNRHNIRFIVDDDSSKWGSEIYGIQVTSTDNVVCRFMDYDLIFIAVGRHNYHAVMSKLESAGIPIFLVIDACFESIDFS